eukprot:6196756-Pleurochrysis_carterae.AAC.3
MCGWTMLCKLGHPVNTLPVTNGTIRHTRRMTEILRFKRCTVLTYGMVQPAHLLFIERAWSLAWPDRYTANAWNERH